MAVTRVDVRAHARLHFGFLDLSGSSGRRFGGLGLALSRPRCVLSIEDADRLSVEGEQAERVELVAARVHDALEIRPRARIRIIEAIPEHVGLGSGTQLAMALAAGIVHLRGLEVPIARLYSLMGRVSRSGVGYHLFRRGGFVVEGGHADEERLRVVEAPPLLARHEFPKDWRILVAIPNPSRSDGGEHEEEEAFRRLRSAGDASVERIARVVLTKMLPALAERNLKTFGASLAEAQESVGSSFLSAHQDDLHPGSAVLARRLREAGAQGVGQSSWGPAVYAITADEEERRRLARLVHQHDPAAILIAARGWNRGARIDAV